MLEAISLRWASSQTLKTLFVNFVRMKKVVKYLRNSCVRIMVCKNYRKLRLIERWENKSTWLSKGKDLLALPIEKIGGLCVLNRITYKGKLEVLLISDNYKETMNQLIKLWQKLKRETYTITINEAGRIQWWSLSDSKNTITNHNSIKCGPCSVPVMITFNKTIRNHLPTANVYCLRGLADTIFCRN